MENIELTLKQQIIQQLNLEDITPDDIDTNAALFNEGLGLDSIDALELIVLLEKEYGLKVGDSRRGKEILFSVKSMADYIRENGKA
jgi:acyl carrier protein